jgi:hypothetical protein
MAAPRGVTTKAMDMTAWGKKITIPKGTTVLFIQDKWAIESSALLFELTGNCLDPYYKFVWIDKENVKKLK